MGDDIFITGIGSDQGGIHHGRETLREAAQDCTEAQLFPGHDSMVEVASVGSKTLI